MTLCLCGCGQEIIQKSKYYISKYIFNHHRCYIIESYKNWMITKEKIFCLCGCGEEIIIKNRYKHLGIPKYIRGHQNRNGNHPKLGIPCSTETKRKKRKTCKGFYFYPIPSLCECGCNEIVWNGNEWINGHCKNNLNKHHSEKTKRKISQKNKGKIPWNKNKINPYSKETINKMKINNLGINNNMYGRPPSSNSVRGHGSYYNSPLQETIWLRSSYEIAYAKYLDSENILWLYEIETFDLDDSTYTPDFFLIKEEKFIEIKGYMSEKAQLKINKFLKQYPWDLEILRKEDLIKLNIDLN